MPSSLGIPVTSKLALQDVFRILTDLCKGSRYAGFNSGTRPTMVVRTIFFVIATACVRSIEAWQSAFHRSTPVMSG